jgi:hypothetical protein
MVDVGQVVLGIFAVSVIILAPILCLALYDLSCGRWDETLKRWHDAGRMSAEHRRNLRALKRQQGVPIEQVAADLRRLRLVISGDEHRSAAHQIGNRLAYDKVLMQACNMLGIEHELAEESSGLDRDIERLRVEAELERAGVVISTRRYGQAA